MSFNSALSVGNYTSLRTGWKGEQFLTFCENTEVFAARVDGDFGGVPIAQFFYDTVTVGVYTDIELGQVLLISHTNDKRKAYFRGRIREAPTSGIINMNETSAEISDNDYFWVIDTYDLTDKLARPAAGVQLKDYNETFQRLLPVANGLRTAYVGWVDSGTGKLRVALNASTSYAAESGATMSSYQYTFRASSYTVISGALNTHTVTVDIDPGVGQWGKLVITDSGGRTQTYRFYIKAHDDTYPPDLGFDGSPITGNLNEGFNANLSAFDGVSGTLDQTFTVIWTKETYDTETNIVNNIDCVGWLRQEEATGQPNLTYSMVTDATFSAAGPGAMLGRLESQLLALRNVASPDEWDEINNLTIWRAIVHYLQRHTTALNLCCLNFDSTDNTFLFPYMSTQGGNALGAVNGILEQINAALEFAPDGRIQAYRMAEQLDSAARTALTTVANWDNRDFVDPDGIAHIYEHLKRIGKIDADGAFYNASAGNATALRSRAPGYAQGDAEGSGSLNGQILAATTDQNAAQDELNQRSGNKFDIENNTVRLRVQHGAGYHFLIPSLAQWYTWTLTTAENNRGISYTVDTRWMLESIQHTHSNERGTRTVQAVYRLETAIATPGDTVPIVPDGTVLPALPEFPLFDAFAAFPDIAFPEIGWLPAEVPAGALVLPKGRSYTIDGNTVIIWTENQAWMTHTFAKLRSPIWFEITPVPLGGSYTIRQVQIDPTYTNEAMPCYLLASDGTNSKMFYTANVCDKPPVWTEGAEYAGIYTSMRAASTAGRVEIYAPSEAGSSTVNFTYTFGSGPASASVGDTIVLTSANQGGLQQYIQFTTDICVAITVTAYANWVTYTPGGPNNLYYYKDCGGVQHNGPAFPTSAVPTDFPADTCISEMAMSGDVGSQYTLTVKIESSVCAEGNATVRLSTDYGTTFAAAVTVGTSPGGQGGFDLNYIGAASLAGADQQVKIATTLGGAYGNETNGAVTGGQPILLLIPWYAFGSTTTTQFNDSSPEYLLGSPTEISSNALWRVTSGGQTDVTPAASAVCYSPFSAMTWKGTKCAILMDVAGVRHLYTTLNLGGSPPTWTDRSTAVAGAIYCRGRRKSKNGLQLYICGGSILKYSSTQGANLYARTPPTSDLLKGIEVVG